MPIKYQLLFVLLSCSIPYFASAQESKKIRTRLYKHVQAIDAVSDTWRPLHAFSRIAQRQDSLSITIWYHWASEYSNPLIRVALLQQTEKNISTGKWHYTGTMFTTVGDVGKKCYVESYNEITANQSQDFTIILVDYSVRYRMSSTVPKKR